MSRFFRQAIPNLILLGFAGSTKGKISDDNKERNNY
jgi:hypothetical protein